MHCNKGHARKVAILYWRVMVKGLDYAEQGINQYEQQLIANKVKALNRLVKELNVKLPEILQVT